MIKTETTRNGRLENSSYPSRVRILHSIKVGFVIIISDIYPLHWFAFLFNLESNVLLG